MSAIASEIRVDSPWRRALPLLAALLLAVVLLYRGTFADMVEIWWRSGTFTHAFLVLPISLWLVWQERGRLASMTPRPNLWMLPALLAVALVWLLADLVVVNAATQFSVVAMLVLAVPLVLGLEISWAILFPLLFLFFMVPFGEFLMPALMKGTADFTVAAIRLTGIPVYREGQTFVIPNGTWSVVEACSGVRYLIASVMVGSLFAYLNFRTTKRRILFMVFAFAVPVVANWLRAYMIVMLGYLSGNRLAVGVDHLIYGWVFFGIVITIMFVVGTHWAEAAAVPAAATSPSAQRRTPSIASPLLPGVVAAVVLLLLPPAVERWLDGGDHASAQPTLALPAQLAPGWSAAGADIADWKPHFFNPSAQAQRAYLGPEGSVGVYIAYYRDQGPQHKLISSDNVLVESTDHDWNQLESGRNSWAGAPGISGIATAKIVGSVSLGGIRPQPLTVWRLEWVDGRFYADDITAKLAGAVARLRGRVDDGAALVLYAQGDPQAAAARLQAFTQANIQQIRSLLESTRVLR